MFKHRVVLLSTEVAPSSGGSRDERPARVCVSSATACILTPVVLVSIAVAVVSCVMSGSSPTRAFWRVGWRACAWSWALEDIKVWARCWPSGYPGLMTGVWAVEDHLARYRSTGLGKHQRQ